jgi:uncharacterized protein (DUF305 family)
MSKKWLAFLIPALLAAALVSACGGDDSGGSAGNEADAAFVADMVPHHEGAVMMANMALVRAEHPELKAMARDIIAAQEKEIAQMDALEPDLPDLPGDGDGSMKMGDEHMGHTGMDAEGMGMDMDPADLITAESFDIAFIEMMIPHHEGAIDMANDLLREGENPDLQNMARAIVSSQAAEIKMMRDWKKEWSGEGPALNSARPDVVASISGADHVHGVGVNPAGGEILIATHNGLWQVPPGATEAERLGDSQDDFMGFTVVGPDRFMTSGHPGPGSDLPPLLGLQSSVDGGNSWQTVSLLGEADLHVLRASGKRVYGVDSTTGTFLASEDGGDSWEPRNTPAAVIDLAISPGSPRSLVATTEAGIYGSTDAGENWKPLARNLIGLLTWPAQGKLLMVDGAGRVMTSSDGGMKFVSTGTIGSAPEAFGSGDGKILASTDGGKVVVSTDAGRTWSDAVLPK